MVGMRLVAGAALVFGAALACAQDTSKPAYLNTSLPAEQRAADLVSKMTLEEKASQLVNQARAIPRLGVPAYDWWSEALHGVANTVGVTSFPEPIALAATFDTAGIHEMAIATGTEARVVHDKAVEANGDTPIFRGLDFWAPNLNIFRDPRWGRGQETYGEDPFLTGRMGVAYVTGMQGDDPRYYRVISTPKHFDVHSGPEPTRHFADVDVSKHDEIDTYLPAFRAAVTEGKADSVMCAYNGINGQPACANEFTLQDQLRGKWGFQGYVVSDCGAVRDIFEGHHYEPTQAQASAISLQRGMDNECVDFRAKVLDDHDYKPYVDAVKAGYLKESDIDTAVTRLFTARMKLGMFDPPEMVPYAKTDPTELDSAAHRALALKLANEAMVLLKNDGTLPLQTTGKKILVVGPLAEQTRPLLGNYNGIPSHMDSILDGIKKEFAGDTISFMAGTGFLSREAKPVPNEFLTVDGKPGVKTTYLNENIVSFASAQTYLTQPIATRMEPGIDIAAQPIPEEAANKDPLTVKWETTLTPKETGDYNFGVETDGFFRVFLNNRPVVMANYPHGVETLTGKVHLQAGKGYPVRVEFQRTGKTPLHLKLVWGKIDESVDPTVATAAKDADVVVAVVGITSQLEGEEMNVSQPGFLGGDRTSLDLPQPEEDLLKTAASAGKPMVVVLTNGSALAVNWANQNANAILDAWYPGEEGGNAVAQTLSGANNPAGRLPVTFYKGVDQLPNFEDYSMKARTYRYFTGTPLYSFGYGLSYTKFAYSGLTVPTDAVEAGKAAEFEATVTNTGSRAGDEVAELYLKFPNVAGAPRVALRGFKRVHLEPGASTKVHFQLDPRALSMVTDLGVPTVADGQYTVSVGGGQPDTGAPVVTGTFNVKGTVTIPE
ncbi:MAG TPA: glycoside hydrolase family 3 C-terminal domain-containing protein [Terracidiphilus sp.]|jgi:beta-glucosidase